MVVAIIPAAGGPQNPLFPGIRDLMIPINGKPTVDYILAELERNGVSKVVFLLDGTDAQTKEYLACKKAAIDMVVKDVKSTSILGTLLHAEEDVGDEPVLISLGDTIYTKPMDFSKDFIVISHQKAHAPEKWCFVTEHLTFHDKPAKYQGGYIVCGVYFMKEAAAFFSSVKAILEEKERGELAEALALYVQQHPTTLIDEEGNWFDTGHLNHYYRSKMHFLRSRSFNRFTFDEFAGVITKNSTNTEQLQRELHWFQHIPDGLKIFTPRLVSHTDTTYSLEFYGYPTLGDLYTYGQLSEDNWQTILERVTQFLTHLRENHQHDVPREDLHAMYVEKTLARMKELPMHLTGLPETITINGKAYANPLTFVDEAFLEQVLERVYDPATCTVVHGDLCFNNVLYDVNTGIFKLVDPRGKFGSQEIYGDLKYDVAKLRHSISGLYDFIIADLFTIDDWDITFLHDERYAGLQQWFDAHLEQLGFNLETIKTIEGLLFLSMIPLHADSQDRQKAMFARATQLLNEVHT